VKVGILVMIVTKVPKYPNTSFYQIFHMKYFIIAGEASGDLHGSNLVKAMKQEQPNAEIVCWGGDLMETAGAKLLQHYSRTSFMGFFEVIQNLKTILNAIKDCKKDIEQEQPNVLILIDFPGFNFRIAEWAKKNLNLKIIYYISPQLWAWKEGRIKKIKRDIDRLFVILPFEKDFYKKHQYEVEFVGHPLLDVTEDYPKSINFKTDHQLDERKIIALLPGSRKQEIEKMLGEMLQMVTLFPNFQFVIAAAPSQTLDFYKTLIPLTAINNVKIIANQTYDILQHSHAALVTSGTATLETALFEVPQVVCYKGNPISYHIAKRLVNIKYISLVNLIMDKLVVTELIQSDLNIENIKVELEKILLDNNRKEMITNYGLLKQKLGGKGASKRVAKAIFE
jgi:lipid-A-disaccharide synthase